MSNEQGSIKYGIEGFFTIEALTVDEKGVEISRRTLAGPFKNLITNAGMDALMTNGSLDTMNWCSVGSGNTTPAFTDSSLVSRITTTLTIAVADVSGVNSVSPYYCYYRRTYQFAAGTAAGNLSEVGVGWAPNGTNLSARALIVDTNGNPTTITVLPTEILNVTYERRLSYATEADVTSNVTISGTTYTIIGRPAALPNNLNNLSFVLRSGFASSIVFDTTFSAQAIAAVSSPPNGGTNPCAPTFGAYVAGSFTNTFSVSLDVNSGNYGGLASCFLGDSGYYQFGFTPAIPKTNLNTLQLTFSFSLARV